jgi:integrase
MTGFNIMKIGHIKINVRQYADGRWGFDDYSQGERRMVRLWKKEKAEARATDTVVLLANGRNDLLDIDPAELAEFRKWQSERSRSRLLSDLCGEFLQLKSTTSSRHFRSLSNDIRLFEQFIGTTQPIAAIMASEIQRFLDSRRCGMRRKANLRSAVVNLFSWARRMSYLDRDRTTEAEKVDRIKIAPGEANIITPDQMRTLIRNVQEHFMPWLLIGAFAGIRSEEITPDPASKKSPLMWEDFDWKHNVIIVRAATAKTRQEREVPILPNLAQWLTQYRTAKGAVLGDAEQPSKREATRIGKYIGGWKHNCLRDSFCSYRARVLQNVPQVSYEMGNSISMVTRSYHRRQPVEAAREWFNIRPAKGSSNLVLMSFDTKVPTERKYQNVSQK